MEEYVLVKFSADWADEFDVSGFAICSKEEWGSQVEAFKNYDTYGSYYFGTNEGWESDEISRNWLRHYTVTPITPAEIGVIDKFFGGYDRGHFPRLDELEGE